jgi:protein ImuB
MSRFMTIWLPRWPVQRRLRERPEWRKVPVFVCRRERRGVMAVASWAWADAPREAASGVRAGHALRIPTGTSLAEAMALLALTYGSRACHVAQVVPDAPAADLAALELVARWCRRFSPAVAIATVDDATRSVRGPDADHPAAPDCLFLDVTGTAGFFGGESMLVRTAVWTLAARGLHARAAIADTPGAAWAAAHHTHLLVNDGATASPRSPLRRPRRWAVVPTGEQAALLARLPLAALRLDAATTTALREVGIDTVGGVLKLSAKSLASRFPATLGLRRAQLTGTRPEPLACGTGGEALPQMSHAFELPIATATLTDAMLEAMLEDLLAGCVSPLAARGEGVLALQVRLEHPAGTGMTTSAPTVIDIGLFRPSLSTRHLLELVQLRLGRLRLPRELDGIAVEVVAAGAAACRQRALFADATDGTGARDTSADRAAAVDMLLDRLSGRLGRDAVFEPRSVADAQPEHAWIAASPTDSAARPAATPQRDRAGRSGAPAGVPLRLAGRRPIWMPTRPVRVEPLQADLVTVAAGDAAAAERRPPLRFRLAGQVHRVAHAHGPERIETAWWRGPIVRRDYYVVETETGGRFWLFRRLKDGAWFLHGVFA